MHSLVISVFVPPTYEVCQRYVVFVIKSVHLSVHPFVSQSLCPFINFTSKFCNKLLLTAHVS